MSTGRRTTRDLLTFREVGYGDAVTAPMIEELQADLTTRYGGPDETPVDPGQFMPPDGVFVVALLGDEVVGCAGLRRHDAVTVELKRMYVREAHRRRGLATVLLAELERRALAAGYTRMALETGVAQPEAIALYERHGFVPLDGFGHYADSRLSRSYVKALRFPGSAEAAGGEPASRETSASPSRTPDR